MNIKRSMSYILLLYVFFLPIQGLFGIGSSVTYFVKLMLLSLAWVSVFFSSPILRQELENDNRRIFYAIPVFYLLWSSAVYAWNSSPLASFQEGLATAVVLSSVALFAAACEDRDTRRRLVLFAIYGLIVAMMLCWVYFIARPDFLPHDFLNRSRRFYGVIKSPNATAYASMVLVFLVIYAASQSWITRQLAILFLFVGFSSFYATLSRASFIAFVPSMMFLLLNRSTWETNQRLRKTVFKAAGPSLLVVMMIFSADMHFDFLGSHGHNMSSSVGHTHPVFNSNPVLNVLRIKKDVKKTGNRLQAWNGGFQAAIDHWFLGIGPANWKKVLSEYGVIGYDSPHNGLLETFGGLGIVGMLFYFLVPLVIWRQQCEGDPMRMRLLRSLVIFTLVRELVEVSTIFSFAIPGMLFWLFVGLMI